MRMRGAGWIAGVLGLIGIGQAAEPLQPPGFRPAPPGVHALIGARVYTQPGSVFSNATVVIRDGRIAAVGTEITPPPDARVWNLAGQTIYAGFIDPYLSVSRTNRPVRTRMDEDSSGTGRQARATDGGGGYRFFGVTGQEIDPGQTGPGANLNAVTPERRTSQSWSPSTKDLEELRELGLTAGNIVPTQGIIRGQSSVATLGDDSPGESLLSLDPTRGTAQHIAFEVPGGEGVFPNSLMGTISAIRQAYWDARWWGDAQAAFLKSPQSAPRPPVNPALEALQLSLGSQPVVVEPGSILMTERARHLAQELGWSPHLILVASGGEWRRPDLIEPSRNAYIVPLDLPALPKFPKEEGWDDVDLDLLRAWDWAPENPSVLRRAGATIALTTHGIGDRKEFRKNLIAAIDRGLSPTDALAALTTIPSQFCQVAPLLGTIETGKLANLTICDAKGYFDPEGKVLSVWIQGRPYLVTPPEDAAKKKEATPKTADANATAKSEKSDTSEKDAAKKRELRDLAKKRLAETPLSGRGALTNPAVVLVRGATIWTCGPQGILTNASLLVRNGRIEQVGGVDTSGPIHEIDGRGLHVTPGLIDAHSHSMIVGGVNEGSLPSSAMVRIGDVVNSETPHIHQQLAGGLTIANLLHGSANPIGGQNQVIKLRSGASPEDLKFTNAPSGIKFALGENVKQANWGDKFTTRFPQTRMGVPTFIGNRFTAAQQYAATWKAWRDGGQKGPAPRRDLELDAIVEILEGKRLIHCHSYRQDEILAFLRLMESFGVRVATLQHILEGYKVADEIARHGAGASAFADWWAYKYEVIDAIPYAGALMQDRGVVVSFNSDSSDHARRLNFEAAKGIKYGGMSREAALNLVTLNPAKQLRIDRWVGSLEPGKDADFVVWSGDPLDSSSVCLQTWIEGRQYFGRDRETERAAALQREREALLAKAKRLAGDGGSDDASAAAREKFFRRALEQARHLGVENCQDCLLPRNP
ncbi:MAG: amidohydrolase family protein [Limisphaerales bacterium]